MVSAGAAQPAAADPTPVQTQTETAEAAQHQYSYIALGDSIVAGIGLPDAVYQRNGRYYDVSGNYQGYSKDCYVARVAEGLGLSRDQTANYGMPALMSGDLLELVRTGSCQSASINFSLPDLRQELKHAQVITVEIGEGRRQVQEYGVASFDGKIILLVFSVCGAIGVISVMEPFGATIGPPQERLYPVDPVGVEMMIPSAL